MTKTTKTTAKAQKFYTQLKDAVDNSAKINEGQMWIKCDKFGVARFDIKLDENETLSDFTKCIELRGVNVVVKNNDKGYPTLYICGSDADLPF